MSASVLTGRDPATDQPLRVAWEDGRIVAVEAADHDEDAYLSAGLIDLQVNGFAGHDLNGPGLAVDTVLALARTMGSIGVTSFVPTLITAPPERIAAALAIIAQARRAAPRFAHAMPFVHLEGPWIAPEDGPRGAHPRAHVTAPDLALFDCWQEACGSIVGLVTLSPHFPDAPEIVGGLVKRGVRVAVGHTGATPEQIRAAVDVGASLSTHLGNGAAAMLPRHPNFIWTQLADDRLTACLIADGHHLPTDTFKAMLRAKGVDCAVIVSDSAAPGGLPPGVYDQPIGGQVELSADGRLSLAGTPYLAGAALPLPDGVARAMEMGGIDLATALRLVTRNPGAVIGGRGRLEPGADADLIRFRWHPGAPRLEIDTVILCGERL